MASDSTPHKIFPGFYIGSKESASDSEQMKENYRITHLVSVGNKDLKPKFPKKFEYLWIRVEDEGENPEPLLPHFDKCFTFIEAARSSGGVVLVYW